MVGDLLIYANKSQSRVSKAKQNIQYMSNPDTTLIFQQDCREGFARTPWYILRISTSLMHSIMMAHSSLTTRPVLPGGSCDFSQVHLCEGICWFSVKLFGGDSGTAIPHPCCMYWEAVLHRSAYRAFTLALPLESARCGLYCSQDHVLR